MFLNLIVFQLYFNILLSNRRTGTGIGVNTNYK